MARIDRSYPLEIHARFVPPGSSVVAFPYLSLGKASIPWPPRGTLGLDPATMVARSAVTIPQPAGKASVDFLVPDQPPLVGMPLHGQDEKLTNVTLDVIR